MTDRDHFAAAALTGLLAQGDDGSFSEESYARSAYRWADAMLSVRDLRTAATANHDAAPAARANAESVAPQPTAGDRSGNPTSHSGTGNTWSLQWESDRPKPVKDDVSDRSKPIGDDRLAALEQLSALDQELELKYGIVGNHMIKGQPCKAAKTDATQRRNGTVAEGSEPREGTEPVAWALIATDGAIAGDVLAVTTTRELAFRKFVDSHQPCRIVPLIVAPQDCAAAKR